MHHALGCNLVAFAAYPMCSDGQTLRLEPCPLKRSETAASLAPLVLPPNICNQLGRRPVGMGAYGSCQDLTDLPCHLRWSVSDQGHLLDKVDNIYLISGLLLRAFCGIPLIPSTD